MNLRRGGRRRRVVGTLFRVSAATRGPSRVNASHRPRVASELDLPDPHDLRCDLDALVLGAELHRLFETQLHRSRECLEDVGGRGPHVGEFLLTGDVDVEVLRHAG